MMAREKVDWLKIKNEYVTTDISQRAICEKYSISYNTLKDRASNEKWADSKKEYHSRVAEQTQQKVMEKIVEKESSRIDGLLKLTDIAQEKIAKAFEQLTMYADMLGNVNEIDLIDVNRLKKLISGLKELKEILTVDNSATSDEEQKQTDLLKAIERAVKDGN